MKNVNNIFKPIFLLMVVFCVILSMSCVCAASDINNASTISENAVDFEMNTVELNDVHEDVVSDVESNDASDDADTVKESKNTLSDEGEIKTPGTYEDFVKDFGNLTPGSVVEITKDYNLNTTGYSYITLDKENVTINGNGHMISGYKKDSRIFKITADGVKINNLVFTNPDYEFANTELLIRFAGHTTISNYGFSPIIVKGNHDEINGCKFIDTKAVYGGSIFWTGDNGKIDNCSFSNIEAKSFGGAICMEGLHNIISNCRFKNCTSGLTQDTIYFENQQNNVIVQKCVMDRNSKFYDANGSGLNVSLFFEAFPSKIVGKDIELYRMLFYALSEGGIHFLDKDTYYYYDYYNESHELILNVFTNLNDSGITFGKGYHFNNVSSINDVFKLTSNFDYYVDYNLAKNVYVNDSNSYSEAIKTTSAVFDSVMGYMTGDSVPSYIKTKMLNIVFAEGINITNGETIMASNLGFNTINIDGHGSHIMTTSKDTDEHKWLILTNDVMVMANNLTVSGFNTAVENRAGTCIFDNMVFKENRMDYAIDRDWGAGILNLGIVKCFNCTFTNNYAKNGGAIFNQGLLIVDNCTFANNKGYGRDDHVCVGENGMVILNGVELNKTTGPIGFAGSISPVVAGLMAKLGVVFSGAMGGLIGFAASIITCNPVVGVAVGVVAGAAIGSAFAGYIISGKYDVNFNRALTAGIIIGGCAVAGGLGVPFYTLHA